MSEPVSRAEFDMLRGQVDANAQRLDTIDQSGTRGVGVVQQQLMDLKGDLTELRTRFDAHETGHKEEEKARVSARRWAWSTAIAALVAIKAPLLYLIAHAHA